LTGHTEHISVVAFSPDGKRALSGSGDNTLKLWDTEMGRAIRTLTGHTDYISGVAFSPDGKRALSGSRDDTLKLWNVETGREIHTLTGHTVSPILAFSPNGKQALSRSGDDTLKLWNIETGREIHTLTGHTSYISAITFSPDGKQALSGSYDNTLKLWDVETGREIRTFTGHTGSVTAVAFSPDGKWVLSDSNDYALKLWNIETGQVIHTLTGHTSYVRDITFSLDSKRALSGSQDNMLKLWNIETGHEIRTFIGHTDDVIAVAFSPDGRLALSGSYQTLKLWNVEMGYEIRTLTGHTHWVNAVAFSPDGKQALSGSLDNMLKLWDVETGHEISTLTGHTNSITAIVFSPDGKRALSGSDDGTLKLWNVKTGHEIRTFTGLSWFINAIAFSPDSKLALSGSSGNYMITLWEVETGRETRSLTGHTNDVLAVAFSPDGQLALSGSRNGHIHLYNIETGKTVAQIVDFDNGEWITITPEGYYTASLNGAKHLNVRIGNQVYGIDQYEAIYHRPDIVQLALKLGDSQQAVAQLTRNAPPVQIAKVQPPNVWFVAPQQGYETDRSTITVNIETEEIVDSAESVIFKVNGRPVGSEKGKRSRAKVAGVNTQSYRRQIPLQIGDNRIEVEVRAKSGAVQRTSVLVIRKGKVVKKPDLYFLGIGVADHPILPLKYPVKDVTELAKTFKRQRGRVYKQVFIKTLTNQQATRVNLIKAMTTFFKDAKQGDIAIVYVSGHGMNTSMGYHFLTYDADPDILEATGASWESFNAIYDLPANVFLWVDTCRAGNIVGNTDWKARAQEARPDIFLRDANNRGVIVFASSSGNDVSQEDKRWGHSAFAKALIEGLQGEAAYKKATIKMSYLQDYVGERVSELTDNLQKPTIPKIEGTGTFLNLVLAKK
jgi:WD40 repeat protein